MMLLGFLLSTAIVIAVSIFAHWKSTKIVFMSFVSSCIAVIVFQILGYFVTGYLDPFFLVAAVMYFLIAFLISIVIGMIIRIAIKRDRTS